MKPNVERTARLITESVDAFNLSLDGLTVYTEAATGSYAVTAPIAAAAGADCVYALGRGSLYGTADDAFDETGALASALNWADKINFVREERSEYREVADIVTNTGFVRPIDRSFVEDMKPTAAVPLMYEPWEYRGEVDVSACWDRGIPVIGTDESDERLETQEYVGLLAVQMSLERNIEVMHGRYVVVGGGAMAKYTNRKLAALGAETTAVDPRTEPNVTKLVDISSIDAIVLVDHQTDKQLVGPDGLFQPTRLERVAPGIELLHICGSVDDAALVSSSIPCTPESPAPVGKMSVTTGALGPRPVVELHTAGLAVGATATRARQRGASLQEAVDRAVTSSVGADFNNEFKIEHNYPRSR